MNAYGKCGRPAVAMIYFMAFFLSVLIVLYRQL